MPKSICIDLTNQVFSRLTVIKRHKDNGKSRKAKWECKCSCGKETIVVGTKLRNGTTKSCGCLGKENLKKSITSHNMNYTRPYYIWCAMKNRCNTPSNKRYKSYGGRGISFCSKWEKFEGFWEDMQDGYYDCLSLDRIDVNGNYEKNNCRWVTIKEQANNKRNNHCLELDGVIKTIAEWSKELGINRYTIRSRLVRGASTKDALKVI